MKFVPSHQKSAILAITLKLCLMTLLSLAVASTSWAANYYVDRNNSKASDSNSGTESSPWKTISHAASTAIAGDTVYVNSGTYNEQVTVSHSGASGSPITFTAYPGAKPVIDGSGVSVPSTYGLFTSNNNNYIILNGFEIKNSKGYLIRMYGGSHCEIKNCVVHDNVSSGQSGILFSHSTNGLFEKNEVYNGGRNAVNFESDTGFTIEYNYIHDNSAHNGVNLFPKTSEAQIEYSGNNVEYNDISGCTDGIYSRYQDNNQISNNIIHNNIHNGIYLENDQSDPHNFAAHTLIANNTITGNGGDGILDGNATYLTIENNIIYSNGGSSIYFRSAVNNNNTVGHNLTTNPSFTNASKNDYTLQSGSAAIDAGIDLSSSGITDDIVGTSRPQGKAFDIGAYEFTSGTSSTTSTTSTVNKNPVPKNDTATTQENSPVSINVLANDSDPDGDTLTVTRVSSPSNGTASINGSSVVYTPSTDFFGSDTFTYTVSDGKGGTASANVTVTVTEVLTPPTNLHIQ